MSDAPEPRRPQSWLRRRLRFSLRTLLVIYTLVSLLLGYYVLRVQNELRAAEAIAAASGQITYDWQVRPDGVYPPPKIDPPGPDWLHRYLGPHWFGRIAEVRLNEFGYPGKKNDFATIGPHLAGLPGLRTLSIWGGELDLKDCELLRGLTRLEKLELYAESVIEPAHTAAIAKMKRLKSLKLKNVRTSLTAIYELAAISGLQELYISCDDMESPAERAEFRFGDEVAYVIADFPNLRSLMLFRFDISDDGVKALCKHSELETLVVSSLGVTSSSFKSIAELRHLKHLGVWGWRINDADYADLERFTSLNSIQFVTDLSDEIVPHLAQLEDLERLTLQGEGVTDACVPCLLKLRKLEWLDLSDTGIHKHGDAAKRLQQTLPDCHISLPRTAEEEERHRHFINSKFSGS